MDLAANSVTFGCVGLGDLRPSASSRCGSSTMQGADLEPTTIRTRLRQRAQRDSRGGDRDRVDGHATSPIGPKLPLCRVRRRRRWRFRLPKRSARPSRRPLISSPGTGRIIAVCAFAGLRRGEASALRVGDIDFLRKEIRVVPPGPVDRRRADGDPRPEVRQRTHNLHSRRTS